MIQTLIYVVMYFHMKVLQHNQCACEYVHQTQFNFKATANSLPSFRQMYSQMTLNSTGIHPVIP